MELQVERDSGQAEGFPKGRGRAVLGEVLHAPHTISQQHDKDVHSWGALVSVGSQMFQSVLPIVLSPQVSTAIDKQLPPAQYLGAEQSEFSEVIVNNVTEMNPVLLITKPEPGEGLHFQDQSGFYVWALPC
jgi:hypothetical protein